jgi:hypothetical protein
MNFATLTTSAVYAYMSGSSHQAAARYLTEARHAHYPETKRLFVNWARAENHAAIRYLKLAREHK